MNENSEMPKLLIPSSYEVAMRKSWINLMQSDCPGEVSDLSPEHIQDEMAKFFMNGSKLFAERDKNMPLQKKIFDLGYTKKRALSWLSSANYLSGEGDYNPDLVISAMNEIKTYILTPKKIQASSQNQPDPDRADRVILWLNQKIEACKQMSVKKMAQVPL